MRARLKKMETNIEDKYLMMYIMNNLPSAYDSLIENLEDRLESTFDPLTVKKKKKKKRKLFLLRPSKEDVEDVESLVIKQLTVKLISRKDHGNLLQIRTMVEEIIKEDFKENAITVENMGTRKLTVGQNMGNLRPKKNRTIKQLKR